jgi:NAD(P)-dependent dehydrogenase (short-subunit alcohol dehydrogenase family)
MDMFNLKGKVALVTGGAGGYGQQMVEALAEAGAIVWTASRSLEKNEAFAKALRDKGYEVYAGCYDQADEESIKALLAAMVEKHGKVDILVNNSVLRIPGGYYKGAEILNQIFAVNATGLIMITRAFGDHMAENGSGSIINIGSYMGDLGCNEALYEGCPHISSIGATDYFFHKGGMHNLTRFMASRYGPKGVRCNCLSLGGLFNHQPEPFLEAYAKATMLGRMANNEDVKGIIVYLASEASRYMTGAVIPVDGGYSAK